MTFFWFFHAFASCIRFAFTESYQAGRQVAVSTVSDNFICFKFTKIQASNQTPKSGEDAAVVFFAEKGFTVLERNVRCGRYGELDLVLSQGDTVVFAEVRKRNNKAFGGAVYSISRKKIASLRRNAQWYMANRELQGKIFRFDLIAIDDGVITWVQDILH